MQNPCLVLAGPTATGKTRLSVQLAKRLHGSIISADSMQVYRGLDIGSAKIRPKEREGIPHYLIDALEPEEEFHVARFVEMAKAAYGEIRKNGRLPILVGGTGFYIQAFLRDVDFSKSSGRSPLREELEAVGHEQGAEVLHARLAKIDPDAAAAIHPHNIKRVVRAIEFYETTGGTISDHNRHAQEQTSPYDAMLFVLTDDRGRLYRRIDARVDAMLREGLVDEVRSLAGRGLTEENLAMKGLGYRQLLPYLAGDCSLEEAAARIKTETRHFAKRQLTWFRREPAAIWVDRQAFDDDENAMLAHIVRLWEERDA